MNKVLSGRCLNIGNCDIANSMAPIQVEESAEFVCTECGKPLIVDQGPSASKNKALLKGVAGVGIIAIVSAVIFGITNAMKPKGTIPTEASSITSDTAMGSIILRLSGSNTLGAKLAPALVEAYFKNKGCINVTQQKIEIELINVTCRLDGKDYLASISFKGSSTAFTGLKNGTADVGMASRRANPSDVANLAGQGNLISPANEHVVALDGIAIIVNPSNQIPKLSVPQVRSLFSGATAFFNLVSGPNNPVKIYRRDDKSGTLDSFKSLVMDGSEINATAKTFEDSRELSSAVAADNNGIGFVGHTLVGNSRAVPIGVPGQQALLPNRFTIQTEDYPLSRRLYLYSMSDAGNPEASKFISFAISKEGQAVVERENFVPLEIVSQRTALPTGSSKGYQSITASAERLSVNFRFNSGSNQLDNRALADLDRVTEYLIRTSTQPSKLVMIGFADNVGNPSSNVLLSKDRAQTVAAALKSRGITPGQITGFGSENPIASNDSAEGQQKNRRVEVWVAR